MIVFHHRVAVFIFFFVIFFSFYFHAAPCIAFLFILPDSFIRRCVENKTLILVSLFPNRADYISMYHFVWHSLRFLCLGVLWYTLLPGCCSDFNNKTKRTIRTKGKKRADEKVRARTHTHKQTAQCYYYMLQNTNTVHFVLNDNEKYIGFSPRLRSENQ